MYSHRVKTAGRNRLIIIPDKFPDYSHVRALRYPDIKIGEIARDWLSATGDPDYDSRVYERTERLSEATSAIGTVAKLQNHRECEPLPHRPLSALGAQNASNGSMRPVR